MVVEVAVVVMVVVIEIVMIVILCNSCCNRPVVKVSNSKLVLDSKNEPNIAMNFLKLDRSIFPSLISMREK